MNIKPLRNGTNLTPKYITFIIYLTNVWFSCSYERACKLLEDLSLANDKEEKEQQHVLMKLYKNRGLCYTRVNWPKRACLVLQDALKIDETDAKINFRMGVAKSKQ